jgi:surface antigen
MVTSPGTGAGFTHGGYLERTLEQPVSGSAIRDALAMAPDGSATAALPSTAPHKLECRTITQQVTLPDGDSNSHQFVACQRPDGSWEQTG